MTATQHAMTLPGLISSRITAGSATRNILLVVAASVLIALAARVAVPVPFTPVPMTLQPLAVILIGAVLGARRGGSAALLYLGYGMAGLPVFAHPLGLAGPTAGYLLAFPLAAWIAGFLSERGGTRTIATTALTMAAAIAVIHLGGWSWLSTAMGIEPAAAFAAGVAPFLVGDLLKIGLAVAVLPAAQRLLGRR